MSASRAPAAPFIAPTSGGIDERLAIIADAISRKADATSTPFYSAILLADPTGAVWRVTVDALGQLVTAQAPRA